MRLTTDLFLSFVGEMAVKCPEEMLGTFNCVKASHMIRSCEVHEGGVVPGVEVPGQGGGVWVTGDNTQTLDQYR